MTPRRVIRLARKPTPTPTAPPPYIPIKHLHDTARPQRVAQLIVPRARVEHGGGNALALEPGVVNVLLDLEPDLLHDVHLDLVAPGDAPGAAVLRRVLRARGAEAGARAVDGVFFHGRPGEGLVLVADVELGCLS